MNANRIRLFQRATYGWSVLYALALLILGKAAWTNAPVDVFNPGKGPMAGVQWWVGSFSSVELILINVLVLLGALVLMLRHRWGLGLLVWFAFRIITHRTWLASNGGIQLMENMLLLAAFMSSSSVAIATFAFWAARLQLLLVYAAAAAHKFTGTTWLDGSALLLVANDPAFHLGFLAGSPFVCKLLSWGTLTFMTLFPLAVWWRPSRRAFLLIGAAFHLATAILMDIPQMGLAFIACYAIWSSEGEAEWIMDRVRRIKKRKAQAPA